MPPGLLPGWPVGWSVALVGAGLVHACAGYVFMQVGMCIVKLVTAITTQNIHDLAIVQASRHEVDGMVERHASPVTSRHARYVDLPFEYVYAVNLLFSGHTEAGQIGQTLAITR